MADTSEVQLGYIEEATLGTTPATPEFKKVRMTGESLKHVRQNTRSNEIRSDRNTADSVQVSGGAQGGLNFELSYGAFDDLLEGALFNSWATNVLKNGVEKHSYTIEKIIELGATDAYKRYTGMMVDTFSLSVSAQNMVTGSIGFIGQGGTTDDAIITGATYTDAPTNDVMNAGVDFASLSMTGLTSPKITEVSINVANNLRQRPVVGSIESNGVGVGQCNVTGSITMYFENLEAYDLFLAGDATDLSFKLGGASELNYVFDIPRLKFTDADVPTPGNNQDIFITLPFEGLYDSSEGCALKITRTPAA